MNDNLSALEEQKVVLIKAALKEFVNSMNQAKSFKESVFNGELLIWRETERTFKSSFTDSKDDLLIQLIGEIKGDYHELIRKMISESPKETIH